MTIFIHLCDGQIEHAIATIQCSRDIDHEMSLPSVCINRSVVPSTEMNHDSTRVFASVGLFRRLRWPVLFDPCEKGRIEYFDSYCEQICDIQNVLCAPAVAPLR